MDREKMLATIDALYDIRMQGETEPMAALLAEGATFRLSGEGQMEAAFGAPGPTDFLGAMRTLNGNIGMSDYRRVTELVEGNRCAVLLEALVSFPGGRDFTTEIFNLWSFDDAGKVTSLTEFVDTARLAEEVQVMGGSLV